MNRRLVIMEVFCDDVASPSARGLPPTRMTDLVMTSREFLHHLPCECSARKLDGFGSGWPAPGAAVRADRVVVPPPAFRQDLRFLERVEQPTVQELFPHLDRICPGRSLPPEQI